MKKFTVTMPVALTLELAMRVAKYCEVNRIGRSEAIRTLITKGLDSLEKE